ncbi:hypothetical protein E0K89_014155 [Aquicoccus sp. SCR17]|nr:hypothetical protein [Carideicomes alvinocaridis]
MTDSIYDRARMVIRRAPRDVYEAFANPEIMERFWLPAGGERMEPGRRLTWSAGPEVDAPEIEVRVVEAQPGKRLSIDWGLLDGVRTRVDWIFEPVPEGTLLTMVETGLRGAQEGVRSRARDARANFDRVAEGLKTLLEQGSGLHVVRDHTPDPAAG